MALQKRNAIEFQITNNPGKTTHFGEAGLLLPFLSELNKTVLHCYLNIFLSLWHQTNSTNLEYMFSQQGIFLAIY